MPGLLETHNPELNEEGVDYIHQSTACLTYEAEQILRFIHALFPYDLAQVFHLNAAGILFLTFFLGARVSAFSLRHLDILFFSVFESRFSDHPDQ